MKEGVIIIGAGGHGKVVLSTLLAAQEKIAGFVDDNANLSGKKILGYPVLGSVSLLADLPEQSVIFGIGSNALRKRLAKMYAHLHWKKAIHPFAYVHESVHIGAGSVIFAGAVIQPESRIGEHVIVNTSVSIDHDCEIGDFVHLAPGTHLAGEVSIAEGCFLGVNSAVIPKLSLGKWTQLGAGSVVVKSIPPHSQAKGVPAKTYKEATHDLLL